MAVDFLSVFLIVKHDVITCMGYERMRAEEHEMRGGGALLLSFTHSWVVAGRFYMAMALFTSSELRGPFLG